MSPPRKICRTDEGEVKKTPDGVIRFELDKVSELQQNEKQYSPEMEVRGVPWVLCAWRGRNNGPLSASLWCKQAQLSPFRIDGDAEFTLVNSDSNKNITHTKSTNWRLEKTASAQVILDWESLTHKEQGFIKDDKIKVEVRFWISGMKGIRIFPRFDFTDSEDPRHDITFLIEGEKVHTSKAILASHSPFFKAMLYGDFAEKNKEEIEIKDVKRKEFIEMLQVLYSPYTRIESDAFEYIIKLADRFQFACLIDSMESDLIENNDVGAMDKLRIADKYVLYGLLEHCLSKLTTADHFKDIEKSPLFKELSDATKAAFFTKLVKIAK